LETAAVRCYGTGGRGSDWKLQQCDFTGKLQQCDVTAPVGGGLTGNCSSAMLRHPWLVV